MFAVWEDAMISGLCLYVKENHIYKPKKEQTQLSPVPVELLQYFSLFKLSLQNLNPHDTSHTITTSYLLKWKSVSDQQIRYSVELEFNER